MSYFQIIEMSVVYLWIHDSYMDKEWCEF